MFLIRIKLLFLFLLPSLLFAREVSYPIQPSDSILSRVDSIAVRQSNSYYDALINRSQKSKFSSLIVKSLLVVPDWKNSRVNEPKLVREEDYFNTFKGKKIKSIDIFRTNIISQNDSVKRPIENFHILTRRRIIRRSLFFKEGQILQPDVMVRNEQYLRSLPYLADAYILIQEMGNNEVAIFVYTRDNLSLSPGFTFYGIDKMYGFVQETNLMGSGTRLEAGVYTDLEGDFFRGHRVEYTSLNLLGTFTTLDILNSRDFNNKLQRYALNKEFMSPLDWAGGLNYQNSKYSGSTSNPDSTIDIESRTTDIWGGASFPLFKNGSSFYFTARYFRSFYPKRYNVNTNFNPIYHKRDLAIFSVGLYRERFYRGSLIYGFGRSEDIPYGYKFEIVGGHSWEEFTRRWYIGGSLHGAGVTNIGYFGGTANIGSFFDRTTLRYKQSSMSADGLYFTNLATWSQWGFRSFLATTYTYGFNRMEGDGEVITLNSRTRPRAISDNISTGIRRFTASLESVAFAPFYLLNFRFAFFGYTDWAWLGNHTTVFNNDYCSTVGFGVRIKNERLVFQTIQIRLGFAIATTPNTRINWLDISDETRIRINRLFPGRADLISFQ